MEITVILIKLLFALVAGALIGYEREKSRYPAGLKTHILAAMGAAVFTMVALQAFLDFKTGAPGMDLLRVISGVAMGIGFIGAGAIIQSEEKVKGLSAAASIWIIASVGVAIGLEYYLLAALATIISFLTLLVIERMDGKK